MKVHCRFLHKPTKTKYLVVTLTTPEERNRAFELLYRKYIGEAENPWQFDPQNPSGIHVETRWVNDAPKKVLVDRYEEIAIVGGIVDESTGVLTATCRSLIRKRMPDGLLELEHYRGISPKTRKKLSEGNIQFEFNRMAVEKCMKKKHTVILIPYYLMLDNIQYLDSSNPKKVDAMYTVLSGYAERLPAKRKVVVGEFKHEPQDPHPVTLCVVNLPMLHFQAWGYAKSAGCIETPAPAGSVMHTLIGPSKL